MSKKTKLKPATRVRCTAGLGICAIPDGYHELTTEQKGKMLGYVAGGMFLNTETGQWVTDRWGRCWCSPGTTDRIIMPTDQTERRGTATPENQKSYGTT